MLLTTEITDNAYGLFGVYTHQERVMVKGYLIFWLIIYVNHTWEILRQYL